MCVITSLVTTSTVGMLIGSVIESAAVAGVVSAGATAALGGEEADIWRSALIGAGFGGIGAGLGAAGGMLAGSIFGSAATSTTAGATTATTSTAAGSIAETANGMLIGATSGANTLSTAATTAVSNGTITGAIMGGVAGSASSLTTAAQVQGSLNAAKLQQEKLNQQASLLNQQAVLEEHKAALELENAEIEKMDQKRKKNQLVGKGRVAAAANGVMLEERDESLASIWEQDVAIETAYDNEKIQHNADIKAWGYRENAKLMRYQGNLLVLQGNDLVSQSKKNAMTSWLVGAGTTALSSFGSAFASGAADSLFSSGSGTTVAKTSDSWLNESVYGGVGMRAFT